MSLMCFMDFMWRYHGSKGVPETLVEDGVLGNLAPPGDLEESASHHGSHPGSILGTSCFRNPPT